jgi:hypothetical protein
LLNVVPAAGVIMVIWRFAVAGALVRFWSAGFAGAVPAVAVVV